MPTFEKTVDEVFVGTFSGRELDPTWRYTDEAGHRHYAEGKNYPTLEWYVDSIEYCDECQEDHESGHWVCPLCLESIKPGERAAKQYIPGMVHYKIDGVEVDEDKWHEEYEKAYGG